MTPLLAQVGDGITTPEVDWLYVSPITSLTVGALLLLTVSALTRRKPAPGVYASFTLATAGAGLAFSLVLWQRVIEDGEGPRSILAGSLGVDGFSLFISVLVCVSVILVALLADDYLRREGLDGPEFYALMLLSAVGALMMASANDLIIMFLGLEIMSIAVYVVAAMHLKRIQSQEAAIKYFVLGAFASAFFLYGIALIYGATGSTNLVDIATFLATQVTTDETLLLAGTALLLVGFGFKVAAVPFHAWTPDVYQGSPTPAVGYMASAVKAGGFAGMLRVLFLGLETQAWDWQPLVYAMAILTLLVGAVLAVVQTDVKRMLAYSSISHAGFILVAVEANSDVGVQAALFYLLTYAFMVIGSFGVATVVGRRGDARHSLDDYRGLGAARPVLALAFTILLLAQAGVPLTSGFFAKFYVIDAAVEERSYPLAVIAMVSAVIAAFLYLRIIVAMYMSPASGEVYMSPASGEVSMSPTTAEDDGETTVPAGPRVRVPAGAVLSLGVATIFTVVVGFLPGLIQSFAQKADPHLVPFEWDNGTLVDDDGSALPPGAP